MKQSSADQKSEKIESEDDRNVNLICSVILTYVWLLCMALVAYSIPELMKFVAKPMNLRFGIEAGKVGLLLVIGTYAGFKAITTTKWFGNH